MGSWWFGWGGRPACAGHVDILGVAGQVVTLLLGHGIRRFAFGNADLVLGFQRWFVAVVQFGQGHRFLALGFGNANVIGVAGHGITGFFVGFVVGFDPGFAGAEIGSCHGLCHRAGAKQQTGSHGNAIEQVEGGGFIVIP